MTTAIRTEKLGKIYRTGFFLRPYEGLADLDLEVPEGTAFGFVGPNGAGKTTTIKILMGLQSGTSGRAWIHGEPVPTPASRRRVGFLPERPYFYDHLTAYEFMDFYASLSDLPVAGRDARIRALLARVELDRFAGVPLNQFSKGMLQRAGLAQVLIADPDLLVLDEPMSGLDPMGRVLVRDIIIDERRRGKTVFFSSHILSDIESICDRVAIIVAGRLRGQGTIPELLGQTVTEVDCVFQQEGRRIEHIVLSAGVDALIRQMQVDGAAVISVHPRQKTLEQVLMNEVERAKPVQAARLGVLA
jgi:ABC-2 type transport system ATP-binding protein